jgi:mono/diheme cytochrome c family protein
MLPIARGIRHDEVDLAVAGDVVNRDDVRMVEGGRGAGFAHEALAEPGPVSIRLCPLPVIQDRRPLPSGITCVRISAFTEGDGVSMRRVSFISAFALVCAALITASVAAQNPGGSAEGKKLKNPVTSSPESIAAGKALFQKNCRFCHGTDAKGNGPMAPEGTHPSNLTDDTWDRGSTDGEIFLVISNGAGPKLDMKGYKSKMTETEIWNVVNYVRSLQAK